MSFISDRIKKYVSYNPKTGEYGSWGALRPDQRRDILELCRVCDVFEGAADYAFMELIPENKARLAKEIFSDVDKIFARIYDRYVFKKNIYSDDSVAIVCAMNYGTELSLEIEKLKRKYIPDKQ